MTVHRQVRLIGSGHPKMAYNGLGLCEGKELELQMLKINTNVE